MALRADLAAYLGHGLTAGQRVGGQRLQRDPAAAAAGVRRAGPHRAGLRARRTRCTRCWPPAPAPAGSTARRDAGLRADRRATRSPRSAGTGPDVVFLCSPNNPTGTALDLGVVEAVLAEAPGMVVVDEAYAEFARPGTPQRADAAAAAPAAGGDPDDEQGVRASPAARLGYLAARPGGGRRGAAGPAAVPPLGADPGRRPGGAGARATRCSRTVEAIKAQRDRIVAGAARAGAARWPTATPTSSCSDGSATSRRPGRRLLDRGVLVRDVGLPGWLRVTAGTAGGDRRVPDRDGGAVVA